MSAGNNNEGKRYRFSRRESFLFVYLGSETRSRIAIIECNYKVWNDMEHINGQNNELTLIFPHGRVNCISAPNERFAKVVNRANITIAGNNNQVSMCFESEDKAEELLLSDGFLLIVKGDNNIVNVGTIILRYSSILGMTGLKLIIGQLPGLGGCFEGR